MLAAADVSNLLVRMTRLFLVASWSVIRWWFTKGSDLCDIDQGKTTATMRADTAAATLRERREPSQVLVRSTSFTASSGTVEAIDSGSTLFSVYSPTGIPTGTFNLTLASLVNVSLLTIDIAAMASSPSITVSVSSNGLTRTPASSVVLNGYRLNAWIPQTPAKYIQLVVTPTHPDNLGGSTYTFGITDLSGTSVSYNLVSDVFFEPITFPVQSASVQLVASDAPGLTYYLTLEGGTDSPTTSVVIILTRSLSRRAYIFFARAGEGPASPTRQDLCSADQHAHSAGPFTYSSIHPFIYIDTSELRPVCRILLVSDVRFKRSSWCLSFFRQGQSLGYFAGHTDGVTKEWSFTFRVV